MKPRSRRRVSRRDFLVGFAAGAVGTIAVGARGAKPPNGTPPRDVYLVPNFHPASCGWLANFSKERVYCANSYLDHLTRVRTDPTYKFVLSEVNNMIAIMNFAPSRIAETRLRIQEGQVELVNASFLESTINLSGGEALIKEGVEGLRWQQEVMGVRPRFAWTIDVCGTHDQMGQICSGLGLDAMVYTRMNPTGSTIHWAESPDGLRIMALCPGHYAEFGPVFSTRQPLTAKQLKELEAQALEKTRTTPEGAAVLILGGSGDYNLAPLCKEYPRKFLRQWKQINPQTRIHISTLSEYVDTILPGARSRKISIPTMRGGTGYTFDSFWIENAKVKTWYRLNEHGLQASETLATLASLKGRYRYPSQELYEAWIQMLLNMDRNTLWGSAGGMVFVSDKSWDVRDRMTSVERTNVRVQAEAMRALSSEGEAAAVFNPLNWKRNDPFLLQLPEGQTVEGAECQLAPGGKTLCQIELPSVGIAGLKLVFSPRAEPHHIDLPESIETTYYQARIDPSTGALTSLKVKPSGREFLGSPANVIVVEKPKTQRSDQGDFMVPRPERTRLASSSQYKPSITVTRGPAATTVEIESDFYGGGPCRRTIRLYQNHPRIDFDTELTNIPNHTVVVAEFPFADEVAEIRRGIPNGFSHGAWSKPNANLHGWTKGIVPALRWSDYSFSQGGGVALLDRGLSGREINGKTPIIYLLNATDKYRGYPNSWLSGKGNHHLSYALIAREGDWNQSGIPHAAREYNLQPVFLGGTGRVAPRSFLQTSENMILQAVRREGKEIEIRMIECLGAPGMAEATINFPHGRASLTDLVGKRRKALRGGPTYRFPIRAQQIVTIRLAAGSVIPSVKPMERWDPLVPKSKLKALHTYGNYKGHPPAGD
jgi:alpha-mannosidase